MKFRTENLTKFTSTGIDMKKYIYGCKNLKFVTKYRDIGICIISHPN